MFHWIDHTGELELEVRASHEREVFEDALHALEELFDQPANGTPVSRELGLEAPDRGALLAEYLSELVFLAETEGFVPRAIERFALDGNRLSATIRGNQGEPPHLVKAVTYHALAFEHSGEGWRAHVVLDV